MAKLITPTAPETDPATGDRPFYAKVASTEPNRWLITCDEGWRSHIVCSGMYEWAADWLLQQLERKPYGRP